MFVSLTLFIPTVIKMPSSGPESVRSERRLERAEEDRLVHSQHAEDHGLGHALHVGHDSSSPTRHRNLQTHLYMH